LATALSFGMSVIYLRYAVRRRFEGVDVDPIM
jgi:hypothetical protein